MKATEQYFPVVLFIMLYKVVLTLRCDYSNESYWAVLSCGSVYYAVQGGSNFKVWLFKWKLLSSNFPVVLFIMLYGVVLTFESVDEILKCYHSAESYWAVFSCDTDYYAVQGGSTFLVCAWNPKVWLSCGEEMGRWRVFN